jgi:hypothetical protein
MLNISLASRTSFLAQLNRISDIKEDYDGKTAEGSGSLAYVQHGTRQSDIIYDCIERGLSSKEATVIVNLWRGDKIFLCIRYADWLFSTS